MMGHFQTEQVMHEECVKMLQDPYSTDRLWIHLRGLMRKNRLYYEHWYYHATHRTVLDISHQLGTASFTFKGKLVLATALSKIVINLLPELFRRVSLKTGPNEDKVDNFAPYLTEDGMSRIIKIALSATQSSPSTSHLTLDESDLSFEDIKARYEEQVRRAELCLPFKALTNYLESLIDRHNLRYQHKREFEIKRNTITIFHRLGEVSFIFKGDLNSTTALSKVVLELLSELFKNISKDRAFPRHRYCTIDNKSVKHHFTAPYLTKDGLDRIISVELLLYPDALSPLDKEMNKIDWSEEPACFFTYLKVY